MTHHLIRHTALFLLPVALLTGCAVGAVGAEPPAGERVSLYKRHGAVQCESRGLPLSTTEHQLTEAGIRVLGASCGNDGMAHMAVCGAGTGSIHIVDVPRQQAKAAQALGFAPLSGLPEARRIACQ